jgi:hypothetical protein
MTYSEYRARRLREAAEEEPFYQQSEEDKPETDALMQQYGQMEEQLQQIKPQTDAYNEHLQAMTDVMDRLMQLNPTTTVRGQAERLQRLSGQSLTEAEPYTDEYEEAPVEPWEDQHWGGDVPEWWERQGPEEDTLVKPSPNDVLEWGEIPPRGDPDTGYYIIKRPIPEPIEPGPQVVKIDALPDEPMYAAATDQPVSDADPEDQQAHDDLLELAGIYGLKLGSTTSGHLMVQKGGLSPWRQDFPDYVSAMAWMKANMNKVSKR